MKPIVIKSEQEDATREHIQVQLHRDGELFQQMKRITEDEEIHKTQPHFNSKKPLGEEQERRKEGGRFTVHPRLQLLPPAQLHRCPGPGWPIRMICPLSFHHPPRDNSRGWGWRAAERGAWQDFQTFGNTPLRVPVGANHRLCSHTQWPFCFIGLLQYQNGKRHRWTNEQTEGGLLSQGQRTHPGFLFSYPHQ